MKNLKRILSLLLCLVMVAGLVPKTAFAMSADIVTISPKSGTVVQGGQLQFVMHAEHDSHFSDITQTWSVNPIEGVAIDADGLLTVADTVPVGTEITVTATSAHEYNSASDSATVTVVAPPTYTVIFDSNSGSPVTPQTVESGKTATEPTAPTKEGYTFKGWTYKGSPYDFSKPVTGNITLYARWGTVYNIDTIPALISGQSMSDDDLDAYFPSSSSYKYINSTPVWNWYDSAVPSGVAIAGTNYYAYAIMYLEDYSAVPYEGDFVVKYAGTELSTISSTDIYKDNMKSGYRIYMFDAYNVALQVRVYLGTPNGAGTTYNIISGANGIYQKGSTADMLSFTADGDAADFIGVEVDGSLINVSDYNVESGSTIVELKKAYLESLNAGEHTLKIRYHDGEASTKFTVKDVVPTTYTATVENGTGDGDYASGATITVTADTIPGKLFREWTTSDGVIFADSKNATTTFTMPDKDVTVTAVYDTVISVIDISGITEPVAGAVPSDSFTISTPGVDYGAEIFWMVYDEATNTLKQSYEDSEIVNNVPFRAGTYVKFQAEVWAKEGYVFTPDTVIRYDGVELPVKDDSNLKQDFHYPVMEARRDRTAASIGWAVEEPEPEQPETIDITVVKEWDAPEGTVLPESIEVYLTANGERVGEDNVVLSKENEWRYTWEAMPRKDSDHIEITYSVGEVAVEGYEVTVTEPFETDTGIEIAITNTYIPEEVPATIVVKKTDADGKALAGAKFILRSEGAEYEATSDADGLVTFEEVAPGYYTLSEVEAPEGYILTEEAWNFNVREDGTVNGFSEALPNGYPYKNEQPLVIENEAEEVPVVKYTVTYVANGGTGTMTADIVNAGAEYTIRPNGFTAPSGMTFKCWKIDTKEYKPGEKITVNANVSVTAVWEDVPVVPVTYTVTFDSDGGTAVAAQTVEAGQKATKPTDPTKEGYTFKGWYLGENAYDFATPVNCDITLKATWEKIETPTNPTDPTEPSKPADPTNPTEPSKPADPTDPTEPSKPTTPTTPTNPDVPKTGDNSNMFLWATILFASFCGVAVVLVLGKKNIFVR